jgi:hypothetical protein
MRVKELVVSAVARVQREVCGRSTPKRVRKNRFSLVQPAVKDLRWDVGTVSRPEPDLNTTIARLHHDIESATVEVKSRAVGLGTVELNATPLVEVSESVAVVAQCGSAGSFFRSRKETE